MRLFEKAHKLEPIDEAIDNTLRKIFAEIKDYHPVSLAHDSEINLVAFSPDDQRIVTISNDNTAKVWDLKENSFAAAHLADKGSIIVAVI